MATVTILIPADPAQPTTIKVEGVKGDGCEALTRSLESALGKVTSNQRTDEYYERPERQGEFQKQ